MTDLFNDSAFWWLQVWIFFGSMIISAAVTSILLKIFD